MLESKDSSYKLVAIEGYATHTCLGPCCGKRLSEAGLTSKDRDLRTLFTTGFRDMLSPGQSELMDVGHRGPT